MKLLNFTLYYKDNNVRTFPVVTGFSEHHSFMELQLPGNEVLFVRPEDISEFTFTLDENEDQPQLRLV